MIRRSTLAAILLFAACTRPDAPGPAPEPKPRTLTLLATGDVGSDTDVCGCKAHPLGGVTKRARLVRDRGPDVLVVDAGDLFFRTWSVSPRAEPQAQETALFFADVLKDQGVPAIAVGERDLALGLPYLRRLAQRAGIKLLAANLSHAASGTAAFDAFTLVERGGIKVGLIGAAPELPSGAPAFQVYKQAGLSNGATLPALEAASQKAKAAGAEVIVGLLHLGQARAVEVLSALPPGTIDFAVVAHDRQAGPLQVIAGGKTALMLAGERGKYLMAVTLELKPGVTLWLDEGAVAAQTQQIEAIEARLLAYQREDAGTADPGDRATTVARLARRAEELKAELTALDHRSRRGIRGEVLEVQPELAEDPKTLERYRRYQAQLAVVNTGEAPPNRAEVNYVGSAACKGCHEAAYTQWSTTGHAKAWATMERTRQTANLDCVPCHVTGFDRPGGLAQLVSLAPFINVGCESCHGPGSAHVFNAKVPMDYGKGVPEKVCAECHRAQADQKPFTYEERIPKVLGPGHGRPTAPQKPGKSPRKKGR